jgi:hypothetical protein
MARENDGRLYAPVTVPTGAAPILLLALRSVREEACSVRATIALSRNGRVPPSTWVRFVASLPGDCHPTRAPRDRNPAASVREMGRVSGESPGIS